jgi:hypothetical protein
MGMQLLIMTLSLVSSGWMMAATRQVVRALIK